MAGSVDVCDGPFESDIAQGKHIGITKDHNAEHCKCPRSDTFDACEGFLPRLPLLHFGANLV